MVYQFIIISFLVLDEGPADDINDGVGTANKTFLVLPLVKQRQYFARDYIKMLITVTCLLMQGRSIIFHIEGVEVTKKVLLAKLYPYSGNFDQKYCSAREN